MAQKTKAQILAEIASLLADNTTGDISAQDVRTVVNDITDSYEDLISPGTTSQYWRGDKTWQTFPGLEVTGTLSAAQINGSYTTPITILNPPGANKYYVIENATMHYKGGTVAFTTTEPLSLFYITNTQRIQTLILSGAIDDTTSKIVNSVPLYFELNEFTQGFQTAIINSGIEIRAEGAISGGNGTINFSIKYRIVTTS